MKAHFQTPLSALGEKARIQITQGILTEYFAAIGEAMPSIVSPMETTLDFLPVESEIVTVLLWTGLFTVTAKQLNAVAGKPTNLPEAPPQIKALAEKHGIDLENIRKHVYE